MLTLLTKTYLFDAMVKAIFCDTRQQDGKHKNIEKGFEEMGIKPIRTKLYVGDYSLPLDQSRAVDTKKDLMEVAGNLCQQHKRFAEEADRATELGIELIILVEENNVEKLADVQNWFNWRSKKNSKAITGEKLYKIMKTFEKNHGCRFEFCKKEDTARRIVELLTERKEGEGVGSGGV